MEDDDEGDEMMMVMEAPLLFYQKGFGSDSDDLSGQDSIYAFNLKQLQRAHSEHTQTAAEVRMAGNSEAVAVGTRPLFSRLSSSGAGSSVVQPPETHHRTAPAPPRASSPVASPRSAAGSVCLNNICQTALVQKARKDKPVVPSGKKAFSCEGRQLRPQSSLHLLSFLTDTQSSGRQKKGLIDAGSCRRPTALSGLDGPLIKWTRGRQRLESEGCDLKKGNVP
ncbi:unnamed protein product [Pleuronectes platessa]|uniref:Uncharacterized protein n=1 Tax=Pleuronectes platessa TaxID=8262 RepID=A0A9N7YXM8_PLEPL|nr:unnamed protein product [Pleuronectes platessa]